MDTIQNQYNQALTALKLALPIILWWLLATGLVNLVARRSQVDAWCEKRPRLAALQKLFRSVGFCPWLLIQGLSLIVIGRLPAKLRATIPVLIVAALAALLSGCAGTLEDARGRISPALTAPRPVALTKRCQSLATEAKLEKVGAFTAGALSGASGITAWPVKSERVELGLIIGSSLLGVAAGGIGLLHAETANQYVQEGCAK